MVQPHKQCTVLSTMHYADNDITASQSELSFNIGTERHYYMLPVFHVACKPTKYSWYKRGTVAEVAFTSLFNLFMAFSCRLKWQYNKLQTI